VREIAEVTRSVHEPVVTWARDNGVRITSPTENGHRSAIVCVAPAKPVEAYHGLKRARVVCSLREGAIRLAPHCYNTVEEMEKVVEVLDDLT
jgi:selenocysteine lyase/cysteine desulfurase